MTSLSIPFDSPDFSSLPEDARRDVIAWSNDMEFIDAGPGSRLARIDAVCARRNCGRSTVYNKLNSLAAADGSWTALVDARHVARAAASKARQPQFAAHLVALAEKNQRSSDAGIRVLFGQWRKREPIPGYEGWPGWPATPAGWSPRNLARVIAKGTDKKRLLSIRYGTNAKANPLLAQVLTTRKNLWPGALYQVDDVWHDHFVLIGRDRKPTRVLELGILDLATACRFHWGTKPRMKKEDGTHENLRMNEMRFFLASVVWRFGWSELGTMIAAELGTAAISEDTEKTLFDYSGGLMQVRRAAIDGRQAALNNYWPGSGGGNFRCKAALEALHSLIHNDLGFLQLQTGLDSEHRPETTDRQLKYMERIVKDVIEHNPHRLDQLRLFGLDYHADFCPFLHDYYTFGLNRRTDHDLEGWPAPVTEYRLAPHAPASLTGDQFLSLPEPARLAIRAAAESDPDAYLVRRKLSPAERWDPAVPSLRKASPAMVCDIIGKDLAREVRVHGSYIEFSDIEISADPLIYEASITETRRELPHGFTALAFANPFAPDDLLLADASGRYIGRCPLYKRISPIDPQAHVEAATRKRERNAAILQPVRVRHHETAGAAQSDRAWNERVRSGAPITPEERAVALADSRARGRLSRPAGESAGSLDELAPVAVACGDPEDDSSPDISWLA
jgi:hypothetical protein